MPFHNRFVEPGRVAYVTVGSDKGKLAVISEIIDQRRVLIDGPCTDVSRQPFSINRLHLTSIVIPLIHGARSKTIKKSWKSSGTDEQWNKTTWAKKLQMKKLRANMSDFDRFKVMRARQMRNHILDTTFGKLRKTIKAKPKVKKAKK